MNSKTISRAVVRSATFLLGVVSTVSVGAVLVSGSASAHAQDFSPFATTFGVGPAGMAGSGVLQGGILSPDGSTITFPLVQQSLSALTITLQGTAEPIPAESAASGYLAVKQITSSDPTRFFVAAAFPVPVANLVTFEQALVAAGLPFTSVGTQTAGLSAGGVVTVHTAGTLRGTTVQGVASLLETILATIGDPQKGNAEVTGPLAIANVPAKYTQLLADGSFSILNGNVLIYSLPRSDANFISLGSTSASESLGVGQTVVISGSGYAVVNVELALRPGEVARVTRILAKGGFSFASEGSYFPNASPSLVFLHAAIATPDVDTFFAEMQALGNALNVVK